MAHDEAFTLNTFNKSTTYNWINQSWEFETAKQTQVMGFEAHRKYALQFLTYYDDQIFHSSCVMVG